MYTVGWPMEPEPANRGASSTAHTGLVGTLVAAHAVFDDRQQVCERLRGIYMDNSSTVKLDHSDTARAMPKRPCLKVRNPHRARNLLREPRPQQARVDNPALGKIV